MITFRSQRTLRTAHAEAFQLMLYQPKDKAVVAPDLWFWNSRDGVTPFGTTHYGVDYLHAMNAYAPSYWGSIPDAATYVWIDYDLAAWQELGRRKWEAHSARDDEYGADFRQRYASIEAWQSVMEYVPGQPRSVTRADFLKATPTFMARFA